MKRSIFFLCLLPMICAAQVVPYPDNSPSTAVFEQYGMPSEDIWTAENYKKAFKLLEKVYEEDRWSLPRKDSPYSGKVFEKMTNIENLKVGYTNTKSLKDRVGVITTMAEQGTYYYQFYIDAGREEQRFARELLYVRKFNIYAMAYYLDIMKQIKVVVPAEQLAANDFERNYQGIREAFYTDIYILLKDVLENRINYQQTDLEEMRQTLTTLIETYRADMTESDISLFIPFLEKYKKDTDKRVRTFVNQLLEYLK